MAKKLGDDRGRDKGLNTEINMEELDGLNIEDPWGGDQAIDDSGGRSPVKASRRMLTEGAKGAAEGAMSVVNEEIDRNMPNVGIVKSELSETYSDLKDMKEEIAKQLQPMMLSMETTARKILPRVEKLMPKSWYDKAKKKLDDRAAERSYGTPESEETRRNELIKNELEGLFSQQMEITKHNEFEQNKARVMDRAVSSIQHKHTQHALIRLYDSVRSTEIFHRTLHTAYMKKSLELKYKHLYVAQDTHNLLAKSMSTFEGYLKGIVKNTSLPDVMKTQMSDYIKKSRTEKYGTMMSNYLSTARQTILKKLKGVVKDTLEGMSAAVSGAEQGADMLEMADEMSGGNLVQDLASNAVGNKIGRVLAGGPLRFLFQKAAPYLGTVNGSLDNVKTRVAMGIDKKRREWQSSPSWWRSMLADFLPGIHAASAVSNDLLSRSEDAASFDKMTRQSIVEIIPGYLGKILHSVDLLRDPNAKERAYNIYKRQITSVDQLKDDIYSDPSMFGGTSTQSQAVGRAIGAIRIGLTPKMGKHAAKSRTTGIEKSISKIITNHGVFAMHFDPAAMQKYLLDPKAHKDDTYIRNLQTGFADIATFNETLQIIIQGLTDKEGKLDKAYVRQFDNAILDTAEVGDGYKQRLAWANEAVGLRMYMGEMINDDRSINQEFVSGKLSRTDSKEVEAGADYSNRKFTQYLKDRAYVKQRVDDLKDTEAYRYASRVGGKVARQYRKGKRWMNKNVFLNEDWEEEFAEQEKRDLAAEAADAKQEGVTSVAARAAKSAGAKGAGKLTGFISQITGDHSGEVEIAKALAENGDDATRDQMEALLDAIDATEEELSKAEGGRLRKYRLRQKAYAKLKKEHAEAYSKITQARGMESLAAAGRVSGVSRAINTAKKLTTAEGRAELKAGYQQWLHKMPHSEEEVKQCVDDFVKKAQDLKNAAPKDKEEFMKMWHERVEVIRARHPKLAKRYDEAEMRIRKTISTVKESEEYKVLSAVAGYAKTQATDAASKAYESTGAKKFIDDKVAEYNRLVELYVTKGKGKKELRKFKRRFPKIVKRWKENAPDEVQEFVDNIGEQTDSMVKGALSWFGRKKAEYTNAYQEGSTSASDLSDGSEAGASGAAAEFKSTSLQSMLEKWQAANSEEHKKIFEGIGLVVDHLEAGIKTAGIGTPQAAALTGETLRKRRYGLFGKGGAAIGKGIGAIAGAAWTATKKVGNIYGTAYEKTIGIAGGALGGLVGGVRKFGGWLTNTSGMTPFVDIFVKGQAGTKPLVTWRQQAFGKGVVYGKRSKGGWVPGDKRVMASKDILKKKVPIFDPETGNMLISLDDLRKGIWTPTGFIGNLGHITASGLNAIGNIYGGALGGLGGVAKTIAAGLFGTGGKKQEDFVDVYLKDHIGDGPLVTRRQQIKPGVFFLKDGKFERVKRSSDIHEAVYDRDRNCLITDEQAKSLVDVDNKPIGSGLGGGGGLIGKAFDLGGIVAKGIFGKTGMKIVGGALSGLGAIYKGFFDALLGGGKAVGRGFANIGARLFGFDTPGGFGNKAIGGINNRLDRIISVLEKISGGNGVAIGGGTGGTPKDRGARGYWKNGKFVPDANGDSYEGDGYGNPGGAAKEAKGNAKVKIKASDNYVSKNWSDQDGDGTRDSEESDSSGSGMDWSDALIYGSFAKRFIPLKWRKKMLRAKLRAGKKVTSVKNAAKAATKAKAAEAGSNIGRVAKAGWKAGRKGGIKAGIKASTKAASRIRTASKAAKTAKKAAKVARGAGKVGRIARLAALGGAGWAGLKGMFSGGSKAASSAATKTATKAAEKTATKLGAKAIGKTALKFLGPAADIGFAAYDAYDEATNAAQYLGKLDADVTTNDRVGLGLHGAMNSLSFGLGDVVGDALYGEGASRQGYADVANAVTEDPLGLLKATAESVIPFASYFANKSRKKELAEANKNTEELVAKSKAQSKSNAEVLNKAVGKYDVGGRDQASLLRLFTKYRNSIGVTSAEIKNRIKDDPKYSVFTDKKLIDGFSKWVANTYPPDSSDPKGRLAYLQNLRKRKDRGSVDKNILRSFGIMHPEVEGEWASAEIVIKNQIDGKAGETKETQEGIQKDLTAGATVAAAKTSDAKPAQDTGDDDEDAVKKFEEFKKIYSRKDRMSIDRNILSSYDVDDPDDPEEWIDAYRALERKADAAKARKAAGAKPGQTVEAVKSGGEIVSAKVTGGQAIETGKAATESKPSAVETGKEATASKPVATEAATAKKIATPRDKVIEDYIKSIGGDDAVRSMTLNDFKNGLKKFASTADLSGMGALKRSMFLKTLDMSATVRYAKAFGITGKFSSKMGQLIDPKTGEPVKLGEKPSAIETGKAATESKPVTKPVETSSDDDEESEDPVAKFEEFKKLYNSKDRSNADKKLLSKFDIVDPDDPQEWIDVYKELELKAKAGKVKAAAGISKDAKNFTAEGTLSGGEVTKATGAETSPTSTSQKKLMSPTDRLVEDYIQSIGGEEEAKKMTMQEFMSGLRKYAMNNVDRNLSVVMRNASIRKADLVGKVRYAKLKGAGNNFTIENGELAGVPAASGNSAPIDVSSLEAPKPVNVVSPQELNNATGMMRKNQFDKVVSAVQANKPIPASADPEMKKLLENTQQMLMGYSKFSKTFTDIMDKDGLKVAGIDTLTAVTAAGANNSGNTQIIKQTVVKDQNEGLDLRKKQF